MSESNWNSPAPGDLEFVRRFLNTWKVPEGGREPSDELPRLLGDGGAWEERFPGWPRVSGEDEDLLVGLRDDLRETLDERRGWVDKLNGWLGGHPLVARVMEEGGKTSVRYEPPSELDFAGRLLAVVAMSVDGGTYSRLKACPDCRWVFYDKSRSRTRVWCGMYAGEGGRACGTIAKVRRYRRRRKAGE